MTFFNFLNFFAIFYGILKLGYVKNSSERENFFSFFWHVPTHFGFKLSWDDVF